MASNRILKSTNLTTISKGGKQVVLAAAIETQKWKRPDSVARSQASGFDEVVQNREEPLPADTAKVVLRESQHSSPGDKRDHYTGCCYDANGNFLGTEHFPTKGYEEESKTDPHMLS